MERNKVGVTLGSYSLVLPFLKVAVLLFQGRVEKYLLTFGKDEILCYKSYQHSAAAFFFPSQKVRKQKFTRLE